MIPGDAPAWGVDWAWGLPLILLTVVFHAYCLSRIVEDVSGKLDGEHALGHLSSSPIFMVGGTALSATILHGLEGAVWAVAYRLLGASPDYKSAALFSGGNDELRPRESLFSVTLANAGCPGSVDRLDSLWPHYRVSFCGNSKSVAV
jgi:hypothetical protein